jgi:hypothetical protein
MSVLEYWKLCPLKGKNVPTGEQNDLVSISKAIVRLMGEHVAWTFSCVEIMLPHP